MLYFVFEHNISQLCDMYLYVSRGQRNANRQRYQREASKHRMTSQRPGVDGLGERISSQPAQL
jgi:hypothetical protein